MRFVFLVPDLDLSSAWQTWEHLVNNSRLKPLQNWTRLRMMRIDEVPGGALNIMRHCAVARSCGVDAVLATMRGYDSYGDRAVPNLPFIRWADRKLDDICIVPDYVTELMDEVKGLAIAYLQVPIHTHNNFNYKDNRFKLWTDSIYMQRICERTYPGKEIEIVPNIIDNEAFKFIPQEQREAGVLFAFPRKGPEFINETEKRYQEMGGNYWKFERIDGISIHELAKQFQRPQVFLASAPIEGCALPPQESMASGIVVVGRTASGANFCMEHRKTAMVAESPQQAAECLVELENSKLRATLSQNAHQYISRYFPTEEPKQFWQDKILQYQHLTQEANLNPIGNVNFA